MADDRISLDFLGEQMLRMQADLRGVRSEQLRQESEQAEMRADLRRLEGELRSDLRRLEGKIDGLTASVDERFDAIDVRFDRLTTSIDARFTAVQAQFEQVHQTMATNFRIVLDAIAELKHG